MRFNFLKFFVIIFALIGIFVTSVAIHEGSHWNDFRHIAEGGKLVLFEKNFSEPMTEWAYYKPGPIAEEDIDKFNSILKYTELKAWSLQISICIFGIFCLIFVNPKRRKKINYWFFTGISTLFTLFIYMLVKSTYNIKPSYDGAIWLTGIFIMICSSIKMTRCQDDV